MERMIIKHLSGSKSNQVEEFPLHHYDELVLGRDSSATVQYDPDRDDLVGRQHARIARDPNDPNGFLVEDLKSRNGTFLNKQKLTGVHKLYPGDSLQLGPGGPEFTFDIEPRPIGMTKATRIADAVPVGGKETRVATAINADGGGIAVGNGGASMTPDSVVTVPTGKTSVGKATVERMISHTVTETKKAEGRKFATIGGAAALAVLILFGVVIGGGYWYSAKQKAATDAEMARQAEEARVKNEQLAMEASQLKGQIETDKANAPLAASEIAEKNNKSVIYIQGAWQLVNKESKSQIYHEFIENSKAALAKRYGVELDPSEKPGPIVEGGPKALPLYVPVEGGGYEPSLTDKAGDFSQPIGSSGYSCSGFIATTDGFILTNRHCASPWRATYSFPQNYPLGVFLSPDGKVIPGVQPPRTWIPENTKGGPRQYRGNYDATQKLSVMLPGTDNPIEARFIQASPRHDVGMIQLAIPGNLPKVELYDNYDTIKKGDELVIMGYPATAPIVYAPIRSQDMLNREMKYTIIPDPTVSTTSVGNIVRNSNPNEQDKVRVSLAGDTIRYAVSLTGGGNSGGPVFDMKGRVIGIHFAGDGYQSGYAVPIRYGIQLFPGGGN